MGCGECLYQPKDHLEVVTMGCSSEGYKSGRDKIVVDNISNDFYLYKLK